MLTATKLIFRFVAHLAYLRSALLADLAVIFSDKEFRLRHQFLLSMAPQGSRHFVMQLLSNRSALGSIFPEPLLDSKSERPVLAYIRSSGIENDRPLTLHSNRPPALSTSDSQCRLSVSLFKQLEFRFVSKSVGALRRMNDCFQSEPDKGCNELNDSDWSDAIVCTQPMREFRWGISTTPTALLSSHSV
jgi:hypothetical protein